MLTCISISFWALITPYFLVIFHLACLPTSPAWGHGSRYIKKKKKSHIWSTPLPLPFAEWREATTENMSAFAGFPLRRRDLIFLQIKKQHVETWINSLLIPSLQ